MDSIFTQLADAGITGLAVILAYILYKNGRDTNSALRDQTKTNTELKDAIDSMRQSQERTAKETRESYEQLIIRLVNHKNQ